MEREALPTLPLNTVPAVTNKGAPVAIRLGERTEDQREALVGEVKCVIAMHGLNRGFDRRKRNRLVIEEPKLDFHQNHGGKGGGNKFAIGSWNKGKER